MKKSRVISALKAQALADKEKALMALDLLENQAVGIGDHTTNDFLKDATESLNLLAEADDRLEIDNGKFYIHNGHNPRDILCGILPR